MGFKLEFTNREISPWTGIILIKKMLKKMCFDQSLSDIGLPQPGSNRGYSPEQLIKQFMTSVWCGANRFEHCEITRQDEVMRPFWDFNRMVGHKAIQRLFCKFSLALNQRIFSALYQWFFSGLKFDSYTLDVDSMAMTRYGEQEGAVKGYNPSKRGRNSHHPLMAFIAEVRMVANFWLRPGGAYTSNNIESFIADTFEKLSGKKVGLFRADSGFYDQKVFNFLEDKERNVNYIIAAKLYAPLQRLFAAQRTWLSVDDGIEIAECEYQSNEWDKPRRIIMVRQHIPDRPKACGKSLRLFREEGLYKNYRHSCYVTNLTLPALTVWQLYRQRADSENRIKELKYDFGGDSFVMNDFYATEAALNFVMMAYNIISLFRQVVLGTPVHQQMKTLRYKVFAIGGYLVKNGNETILKLSLAMKRREWFTGLWNTSSNLSFPLQI